MLDKSCRPVSSWPCVCPPSELSTFVLPPIYSVLSVMEPEIPHQLRLRLSWHSPQQVRGFAMYPQVLQALPLQLESGWIEGNPGGAASPQMYLTALM